MYDLIVIGAGSGGLSAAKAAVKLGAKVAICEENSIGGTCVNRGCIPKKLLMYAAAYGVLPHESEGYGWKFSGGFNWEELHNNVNKTLNYLRQIHTKRLLESGVEYLQGKVGFVDNNSIQLNGKKISSKNFVIACGTKPWIPDIDGKELVLSSRDIFELKSLPSSIAIVGAGFIGVEFASIFHSLGVKVYLVNRDKIILNEFDHEISEHLNLELQDLGIDIIFNTEVNKIKSDNDHINVFLANKDVLKVEKVLYATGRRPKLENLNLANVKVSTDDKGFIIVNEHYQTSIPNIYAVGDVVGRKQLTPVAINEGIMVGNYIFNQKNKNLNPINYDLVPSAVFSIPSVSACGLTEQEARKKFKEISVLRKKFRPLENLINDKKNEIFIKVIIDDESNKVIGIHMVGKDAPEIIQSLAVAMQCGVTKDQLLSTVAIHPTIAEGFVTMK